MTRLPIDQKVYVMYSHFMDELETYIASLGKTRNLKSGVRPFAEKMGISVEHVYKILKGHRTPSPRLALRFEKRSGGKISKEKILWGQKNGS